MATTQEVIEKLNKEKGIFLEKIRQIEAEYFSDGGSVQIIKTQEMKDFCFSIDVGNIKNL